MKLWLDDRREAPKGWLWAKTASQAIGIIEAFHASGIEWEDASFDNDLGPGEPEGYTVVLHMMNEGRWPTLKPTVHSSNPPRREFMRGIINRYGNYEGEGHGT